MRPIIQEIFHKFSGTDVFIIGGGNSLKGFDFSKLIGKNVVALNSAYKYVDENAVLFWGDAGWGATNSHILKEHPSKYKLSCRPIVNITRNMLGESGETFLHKTGNYGYDPNPECVMGNNSGANAINFVVNMNAKRIILLGFDMGFVNGRSHFHDDHTQPVSSLTYPELFIPSIKSLANEFKKYRTVEVINCSNASNLKCFSFGNIQDYL